MTGAILATLILMAATALAACIAWVVTRFRVAYGADQAMIGHSPQFTGSAGSPQDTGMCMRVR